MEDLIEEQKKEVFKEVYDAYEATETLLTNEMSVYDRRTANELFDLLHECVITAHKLRHGQRRTEGMESCLNKQF